MRLVPEILYQDEDLLIVNKPAGMLTIPDRFDANLPSVGKFLKREMGDRYKVFVVHRLDRETSGLMCFALNAEAHRNLSIQFEKREVEKLYWALTEGRYTEPTGTIEAWLEPNPAKGGTMRVSRNGKRAITDYEVLEQFRDNALVQANIRTGRMHQIRVHFAYIGHPLTVDTLYGRKSEFFLSSIKKRYRTSEKDDIELPLMTRTTLHAKILRLNHPTTGERLNFECDLPKDFAAVLNQLQKWSKDKPLMK